MLGSEWGLTLDYPLVMDRQFGSWGGQPPQSPINKQNKKQMNKFHLLESELNILQDKTIGLFKYGQNGKLELVVSENDGLLHTVAIGSLGGLTETHIPENKGIFRKFPNGQTLLEFKTNPYGLNEFVKSFESNN
jgi:hypothetical protein